MSEDQEYMLVSQAYQSTYCNRRMLYNEHVPRNKGPLPIGRAIHDWLEASLELKRPFDLLNVLREIAWDSTTPNDAVAIRQMHEMLSVFMYSDGEPKEDMPPLHGKYSHPPEVKSFFWEGFQFKGRTPFYIRAKSTLNLVRIVTRRQMNLSDELNKAAMYVPLITNERIETGCYVIHIPRPRVNADGQCKVKVKTYAADIDRQVQWAFQVYSIQAQIARPGYLHPVKPEDLYKHADFCTNNLYCEHCACRKAGECPAFNEQSFTPIEEQ